MTHYRKAGDKAEKQAEDYLTGLGFEILERNYRHKKAEIDLIVSHENLLLFVEVKYRRTATYGYPEEFVSENQQRNIIGAAQYYLERLKWKGRIRFDIIALDASMSITHFEDAFY
ncbi:YraN family protein [Reichenbachiella agariperforans]|uniref:YraN family protein n=1 Tax=Reichenbachiella agariperforans TaxID=156994 RepID=UPI001C0812A5|nr:YraN family protein [Reichenbachiella agariperforans]MBU2915835.1 YraN family protein [Reichenbachiella agariperforans]